ncbi:MAG: helix-turn-helix transcriptional regulator [Bacteroidota bacterium]
MNRFKLNIRYIRGLKQLTQEQLSDELGVKRTTIVNWEQGLSYPKMELLFHLKEYFEVFLDDLLMSNMEDVALLAKEKIINIEDESKIKDQASFYDKLDHSTDMILKANLRLIENNNLMTKSAELNAASIDKLVTLLSEKKE